MPGERSCSQHKQEMGIKSHHIPFSTNHLVLKQNTTSINSFNALEFTIYNMTDVKNKDGCKLGSCLHADEDSGAGLFPPEHGDGAMAGHHPWHRHPKAKPASLWAQ